MSSTREDRLRVIVEGVFSEPIRTLISLLVVVAGTTGAVSLFGMVVPFAFGFLQYRLDEITLRHVGFSRQEKNLRCVDMCVYVMCAQ